MSRIGETFDAILSPVLDLIYPPVCLICELEDASSSAQVCEKCWGKLMALLKAQTPLSSPLSLSFPPASPARERRKRSLRRIVSLGAYDPPLEEMIKQFKYNGFTRLGVRLAWALVEGRKRALEKLIAGKADLLLPTPLHIVSYKKRGFNQAEIISDILSSGFSVPVAEDSMAKTVLTKNQSMLTYEERLKNLAGAFSGNPDRLAGKRVILVDDVITTGATICEIGKTAEEAGATVIGAIALASTIDSIPENDNIDSETETKNKTADDDF